MFLGYIFLGPQEQGNINVQTLRMENRSGGDGLLLIVKKKLSKDKLPKLRSFAVQGSVLARASLSAPCKGECS